MGGCCSCLKGGVEDDSNGTAAAETELAETARKHLCISRGMSAPSIEVEDRVLVSGRGLALAAVSIEQDAAYWEVHVEGGEDAVEAQFGVATKKDRKFFASLEQSNEDDKEEQEASTTLEDATSTMSAIMVKEGDVVGVAVQQSDLPMIQLFLNGEQQYDKSINRFRGTVYPSFLLPDSNEKTALRARFREGEFKQSPPSTRFSPVMVARGLV